MFSLVFGKLSFLLLQSSAPSIYCPICSYYFQSKCKCKIKTICDKPIPYMHLYNILCGLMCLRTSLLMLPVQYGRQQQIWCKEDHQTVFCVGAVSELVKEKDTKRCDKLLLLSSVTSSCCHQVPQHNKDETECFTAFRLELFKVLNYCLDNTLPVVAIFFCFYSFSYC